MDFILKILTAILILIFPLGELGYFDFGNGIRASLNDLIILVLGIFWLINSIKNKSLFRKRFLSKPFIYFSVIAFLSLILSLRMFPLNSLGEGFLYFVRWIVYGVIYFVVLDFDQKFKEKLLKLMLISGSLVVVGGFIQFMFYPNLGNLYYLGWDMHLYRMFSSFLDPNFLGIFLVMFIILLITQIKKYYERKDRKTLSLITLAIFTFIALILTYSRSAYIALFISMLSYFLILGRRKLILGFVLAFVLILVISSSLSVYSENTNIFRIASSQARVESITNGISIFKDNFLIGVGYNNYRLASHKYGFLSGKYWETSHGGSSVDNSYVFVLATTGIIGFICYLYLLYKMFKLGFGTKNFYLLPVSLVALMTSALFINSLFYVFFIEWVWLLVGVTENK